MLCWRIKYDDDDDDDVLHFHAATSREMRREIDNQHTIELSNMFVVGQFTWAFSSASSSLSSWMSGLTRND